MLNLVYKYIEIDMANLPHEWYFDSFCQMIMVPLLGYLGKCILCISVGVSWLLARGCGTVYQLSCISQMPR